MTEHSEAPAEDVTPSEPEPDPTLDATGTDEGKAKAEQFDQPLEDDHIAAKAGEDVKIDGDVGNEPDAAPTPERGRTSRDVLYETIGIELINAGVFIPAVEFVDQVRETAGTRIAPRQIATAVSQLARAEHAITPDAVVEIVSATSGDRSSRQQRHADDWRTLGATLTLQGGDGTPEGQRTFIGIARAIAGPNTADTLLLRVALALPETGQTLDPDLVGKIAKRLAKSAADLTPDDYPALVQRELRTVRRARRERTARSRRSSVGSRREVSNAPTNDDKRGPRKLRPGSRRGAGVKRSIRRQRDQ